ncbi:uncharacterized protein LOC120005345 [Tripterygium wilfordii]|uniref:uncharacterized protein LOC120005345 n=1 Tax=Tripterygium wilfordii TaxID=458696 RepID=UPI0018F8238D|nr:uncharacterized protein LOC120005345 [Tripterygium wilfordii]
MKFEGARARTVHLSPKVVAGRCCKSTRQSRYQKRNIKAAILRVREEMAEISETQSSIREGQRQVREKIEKMQREREQLRKETEAISKQSASIQSRLHLMLQISKARAQGDSALADHILQSLRLV